MSYEMQPEVHDSDRERDGCWCGACGTYHSGDCPPEEDDEEMRLATGEFLRSAADQLIHAAGLTDKDFPAEGNPDADAVLLLDDLATKILCEDHEPDPDFWTPVPGFAGFTE